jgi:hypothetical protein
MINNIKETRIMSFYSISKMTVPPGSGADAGSNAQGLLMPKLQYRFRILFENFGVSKLTTELTKQVIDFTRPNVEFPEIPIEIYNSRIYLAGKPTWQAVTVNLRDDASGQIAKLIGEQVQKQFDFEEQASAAAGNNYKFKLVCQILDGGNGIFTPGVLETWELYGCYIASANYNNLNYGTNEPVTVSLSIRFDNAVQTPTDSEGVASGIGVNVGRQIGQNVSGIGSAGIG